jgi:hypothetical protein|nr:hypothetical protein [uncultured Flavobacterium sp.]
MKKLIYLFCITFLLLQSCSSDSGSSDDSSNTFLKKYDGTTWMWEDGYGYVEYIKFNNTTKNPFTIYQSDDYKVPQACLTVVNVSSLGQFNVTENSTNKVVLQIGSSTEYSFYTFELKNGVMTSTIVEYFNNKIVGEDKFTLTQEAINKKNIPICK